MANRRTPTAGSRIEDGRESGAVKQRLEDAPAGAHKFRMEVAGTKDSPRGSRSAGKIDHLQRKVTDSGKRKSASLVGDEITESGLLDHAVLNRKIAEILDGLSGNPMLVPRIEKALDDFLGSLQDGDITAAAKHVCALLALELDDLRRAALLSLMVRLAGKRKFDPVAAYILQNQKVFVTGRG
jgi:hypothetical protein